MTNKTLVAVYGSLRKGLYNHGVIEDEQTAFVGETELRGFEMRDYGSFPYVHHGNGKIKVEIYLVTEEKLKEDLDMLEGYPSFYNREQVYTKYGKAWIYFIDKENHDIYNKVKDGDWKEYINNKQGGN